MTPRTLSPFDRRDSNEPEIISVLVAAGAYVIQMPHSVPFDDLVIHPSGVYMVEVKKPGEILTDRESAFAIAVGLHGQELHILSSIDDALRMLGRLPDWSGDDARYE